MKLSHEELLLYISGELPPERREACDRILQQDPEARHALAELREQEQKLAALPLHRPSRDLVAPALAAARRPVPHRPWFASPPLLALAASLVLLLGAAALLIPRLRPAAVQVAHAPEPSLPAFDDIPREDELDLRIARLRSSLDTGFRPTPMPIRSESAAQTGALTDVRERIEILQTRMRPQYAAAPAAANPFDSRMDRLKSRLDHARDDLHDFTLSRLKNIPHLQAIFALFAGYPTVDKASPALPGPRAGRQPKSDVETRRST